MWPPAVGATGSSGLDPPVEANTRAPRSGWSAARSRNHRQGERTATPAENGAEVTPETCCTQLGAVVHVPLQPNILENGSMPILSAENHFRQGLAALVDGDPNVAAEHFRTAIQIERQRHVRRPQMRYLSYFGLSLALAHGPTQESILACETAARRD